jgi:hypothetical protein
MNFRLVLSRIISVILLQGSIEGDALAFLLGGRQMKGRQMKKREMQRNTDSCKLLLGTALCN